MDPKSITAIFFFLIASEYIVSRLLDLLNIRKSEQNKDTIPSFIAPFIDREDYTKSVKYTLRKQRFSLYVETFSTIAIALAVIFKIPALLDQWLIRFQLPPNIHGIALLLLLTTCSSLLNLPFSIYSQFVIEKEFGFNKMTPATFIADIIKGALVSTVIFLPLMLGIFTFIDKSGDFWWIYAFVFFALFQLILSILYPLVIAPLFNKFKELEEGDLKDRLYNLAEKTSFMSKGIYVMDGSRRSTHSNAYFTGFGKSRRIVLFDTLIESLTDEQIEGVLAHEIGHFKKKHILKRLISSLIISLALFFLLSVLVDYTPLFHAFSFSQASLHGLIIIVSLFLNPLSFFTKPIISSISRKNEYEADRYAVETVGSGEPLKGALISLGKENLSNMNPHSIYSRFHYSHPALSERITFIESIRN